MTSKRSPWSILYRYKVHHVAMWIAYWLFWLLLYYRYYPTTEMLLTIIGIYFLFNASSFYFTAYYLFPRFLYTRKYGRFIFWGLLHLILLSMGLALSLINFFKNIPELNVTYWQLMQISFISISTMTGLTSGIKLVIEKIKTDQVNRLRERQHLESELQYLKTQVNPHFLFNAINSIYFLIKKNPDAGADTLIKLSDLLRFQLYECSDDKIAIEKEVEYLQNFIDLEKIRKSERTKIGVDLQQLSGFEIPPFLFIPFLENAFKFVSTRSDRDNLIEISLIRMHDQLHAKFRNSTEPMTKSNVGGIGLKNVKRRLELLYADKHHLDICNDEGFFSVTLKLDLS